MGCHLSGFCENKKIRATSFPLKAIQNTLLAKNIQLKTNIEICLGYSFQASGYSSP
jgi:hypothetical protein